ncbi:cytochrome c [Rhizobium sp. BK399]|uniref:c-type cytochrome n=1 Tax=Rhizobium sp. BK399 TaxID=2587063 RepID=UPI0016076830|nr:cytochrome c [Rhizobium sp. BK399]
MSALSTSMSWVGRMPSKVAISVLVFGLVAVFCLVTWNFTKAVPTFLPGDERLEGGDERRGALVFAAASCSSCHATPGQTDRHKLGGGLALASPYGTFRAPNISSDRTDGIGSWSASDIGNALVAGISPDREHYYPTFPYTSYTGITLADLRDLIAYMRVLPPVTGRPPPHDIPILLRFRPFIAFWKLLYFSEGQTQGEKNGDALHDRGGYLVEALVHCAECHSTRNVMGAIQPSTRFAGGPDPEGTGFVPNITPSRIGSWTENDIATMLATGETPNHGRVGSSMADVVENTSTLPETDLQAIARYIKSLPSRHTPKP